jgi:hypothetical protein
MSQAVPVSDTPRPYSIRLVFLRGLIWSLIGLIYAPLFTGLSELLRGFGLGHWAFVPAAALAGGVGAALYGARQVALAGTAIGLLAGSVAILALPDPVRLSQLIIVGALAGVVIGGLVRFPNRCSYHVPGKSLTGLATGAIAGGILVFMEPMQTIPFQTAEVVAFLVSVNGVLYVAAVRPIARVLVSSRGQPCHLIQSLVVALLAATAAGSLWVVATPLLEIADANYAATINTILANIPHAIFGGMLGGAVAGSMLEAFRFRWVHEV